MSPEARLDKGGPNASDYSAVADGHYSSDFNPNKRANKLVHFVANIAISPEVIWAPGAEDAINEQIAKGLSTYSLGNHQRHIDPLVLAATIRKKRALRPLIGKTVISAKSTHLDHPIFGKLMRFTGSAMPVLRPQDLRKSFDKNSEESSKATSTSINVAKRKYEIGIINAGGHGAMFPEGTRNDTDNQEEVQPFKVGLFKTIKHVEKPSELMILLMGIKYRKSKLDKLDKIDQFVARNPVVYIDYIDPKETSELNLDDLRKDLQSCVNSARAISEFYKTGL